MIQLARRVWFALILCAVFSAPAAAQVTPASESAAIEVGYQMMHAPDLWFPIGLNLALSAPITSPVSAVAEIGWARHSEADGSSASATNLGAGARVTVNVDQLSPTAKVFGQVLFGVERDGLSAPDTSDTNFMWQVGGGFLAPFGSNGLSFLFQADWRHVSYTVQAENHFRVAAGVTIPFNR